MTTNDPQKPANHSATHHFLFPETFCKTRKMWTSHRNTDEDEQSFLQHWSCSLSVTTMKLFLMKTIKPWRKTSCCEQDSTPHCSQSFTSEFDLILGIFKTKAAQLDGPSLAVMSSTRLTFNSFVSLEANKGAAFFCSNTLQKIKEKRTRGWKTIKWIKQRKWKSGDGRTLQVKNK